MTLPTSRRSQLERSETSQVSPMGVETLNQQIKRRQKARIRRELIVIVRTIPRLVETGRNASYGRLPTSSHTEGPHIPIREMPRSRALRVNQSPAFRLGHSALSGLGGLDPEVDGLLRVPDGFCRRRTVRHAPGQLGHVDHEGGVFGAPEDDELVLVGHVSSRHPDCT
jgi:hypothetical protein